MLHKLAGQSEEEKIKTEEEETKVDKLIPRRKEEKEEHREKWSVQLLVFLKPIN